MLPYGALTAGGGGKGSGGRSADSDGVGGGGGSVSTDLLEGGGGLHAANSVTSINPIHVRIF